MRRKYKLTGCARFLIFLLIAGPVIYISATLITGTSPWEELKSTMGWNEAAIEEVSDSPEETKKDPDTDTALLNAEETDEEEIATPPPSPAEGETKIVDQIRDLEERVRALEERTEALESGQ